MCVSHAGKLNRYTTERKPIPSTLKLKKLQPQFDEAASVTWMVSASQTKEPSKLQTRIISQKTVFLIILLSKLLHAIVNIPSWVTPYHNKTLTIKIASYTMSTILGLKTFEHLYRSVVYLIYDNNRSLEPEDSFTSGTRSRVAYNGPNAT